MAFLYKIKTWLTFYFILGLLCILIIFEYYNSYLNTIFFNFNIKYFNTNKIIQPDIKSFDNFFFSTYNNKNPINKKNKITYCLITIESNATKNIAIVEKSSKQTINLYKIEENQVTLVNQIKNNKIINTSPFFIVSADNKKETQYLLEYTDVNTKYILPRVVEINTWQKDYKIETAIIIFFKITILLLFIYILSNSIYQISKNKKKQKNFFSSIYINQYIKVLIINILLILLLFIIEKIFIPSFNSFFLLSKKYIILYTIFFSQIEYLLLFHIFKKEFNKNQIAKLSKEINQLKDINIDKLSTIDAYSKTIALENLGNLFLFLDGELSSLNSINEENLKTTITKLKTNIETFKNELIKKYDYLIPNANLNESIINTSQNIKNKMLVEYNVKIVIYDNDENEIYKYLSTLEQNNIECLIINDDNKIIDLILKNKINLLIINPYSTGEKSKALCSKIRKIKTKYEFPIIMINKFCSFFYLNEFKNLDINDFIIKPFDINKLIIRIKNLIYQKELYFKNNELKLSDNEKNTFLHFITHNINTPLTILINQIYDLSNSENINEKTKQEVEEIKISCEEINNIIQNVFTAFKLNDGNFVNIPQLINVKYVINNLKYSTKTKAKKKNQEICWHDSKSCKLIKFDRTALLGILNNLIDNAIKYSPYNCKIDFISRVENNHMIFEVINSGELINDNELNLLFKENSNISTKPTGREISLGIGLSSSYKLALLNKSKLQYEKTKDLRNKFSLIIDLDEEEKYE